MEDQVNQEQNTQNQAAAEPRFAPLRVFLKDVSFEMPNAPAILFQQEKAPDFEVNFTISAQQFAEHLFESTLRATVTSKIDDKVLYLIEVTQAGIFEVVNIPQEHLEPTIAIGCPSIIFPYLRASIDDILSRAGFPPLHLQQPNFEAMYMEQLQSQTQAAPEDQAAQDQDNANSSVSPSDLMKNNLLVN